MESLDYCWYNEFPQLHIFLNKLLDEFDTYMLKDGVSQEIWCLLSVPLFSEVLRGLIKCSVCHVHLESFIIFVIKYARICCSKD